MKSNEDRGSKKTQNQNNESKESDGTTTAKGESAMRDDSNGFSELTKEVCEADVEGTLTRHPVHDTTVNTPLPSRTTTVQTIHCSVQSLLHPHD